jgi:hypothetical protein
MPLFLESDYENGPDHVRLKERLRKSLYYCKMPTMDRPSLAMTELAVEMLQDLAPKEFGKVDMYWASDISREVCSSPCSLMLAMLYLKRLKKKNSPYLYQVSSSDLLLVALMVASKYLYDEGEVEEVLNEEWAQSANIDVDEINQLERTFLAAIDWNLFVSKSEFWSSLESLEKKIAMRQGMERNGSFTYTDLCVLLQGHCLSTDMGQSLLLQISKVLMICMMSYCACLHTVALSPRALDVARPLAASVLPYASLALACLSRSDTLLTTLQAGFLQQLSDSFMSVPLNQKQLEIEAERIPGFVAVQHSEYMHLSVENDQNQDGSALDNDTLLDDDAFTDLVMSFLNDSIKSDESSARCGDEPSSVDPANKCMQSDSQTHPHSALSSEEPATLRSRVLNLPKFLTITLTYDMVATSIAGTLASWFSSSQSNNERISFHGDWSDDLGSLMAGSVVDPDCGSQLCAACQSRVSRSKNPLPKPTYASGCKSVLPTKSASLPCTTQPIVYPCCRSQHTQCHCNSTCDLPIGSICQCYRADFPTDSCNHFASEEMMTSAAQMSDQESGSKTRENMLDPFHSLSYSFIESHHMQPWSLPLGISGATGSIIEVAG